MKIPEMAGKMPYEVGTCLISAFLLEVGETLCWLQLIKSMVGCKARGFFCFN